MEKACYCIYNTKDGFAQGLKPLNADLVNNYTEWQLFVNNITKLHKTWTLRYINQY
jgi:hypothetical protein